MCSDVLSPRAMTYAFVTQHVGTCQFWKAGIHTEPVSKANAHVL